MPAPPSKPILKPVCRHHDTGRSARSSTWRPRGLHHHRGPARLPHGPRMRQAYDVRVYLDPPETAASGRSTATAPSAATRPTRCWPTSTAASRTPKPSSARSGRNADMVVAPPGRDPTMPFILDAELTGSATACRTPTCSRSAKRSDGAICADDRSVRASASCSSRARCRARRRRRSRSRSGTGCTSRRHLRSGGARRVHGHEHGRYTARVRFRARPHL